MRINGPAEAARRLPNTLSISIAGVNSHALLSSLSEQLAASAGAACHSGSGVSPVLKAMNLPLEFAGKAAQHGSEHSCWRTVW